MKYSKAEDKEKGRKVKKESPKLAVCSKKILQLTGKLLLGGGASNYFRASYCKSIDNLVLPKVRKSGIM